MSGLKTGSKYLAAIREDEELAALLAGEPIPPAPETPPFYEFSAERYDFAEMKNLMQAILVAAQRGDLSRVHLEPSVPVPAINKYKRSKRQTRLKAVVALITGEED